MYSKTKANDPLKTIKYLSKKEIYVIIFNSHPVSLPRLLDFDWRVDVKIASDSVEGMAAPTCLVQMKVSTL